MSGACRFALRSFGSGMSEVYTDHNLIFFLLCCKEQSKISNEIKSQSFRMEFRPTLGIDFIVNCSIMIEINAFVSVLIFR